MFVILGACDDTPLPPLVASNVEVNAPLPGTQIAAAYLTLTNNSPATISISRILSNQYEAIEIHESTLQDGVAKMRRIPNLKIDSGSSVTLKRGGIHLMLISPVGTDSNVSFQFFSGDTLLLNIDSTIVRNNN